MYGIDVEKKKVIKVLGENETIYAFDHNGKNTFALAISNAVDPGNLYILKDGKRKQLTDFNKGYFRTHRVPRSSISRLCTGQRQLPE
ncbi:unnamed protein product [marine sediment metagenome]|uniref:Uncharacterized protein n=1 Tax=marine sediment metagenome TaxID=412755 RepID=X1QJU7_9ZZZZ